MGNRAAEHGVTAWLHITNLSCSVNVYYVLRNMFSEILSLGEFHNSPNFLPPMCSYNEFAKFSCCQSFPPYGNRILISCSTILDQERYTWCHDSLLQVFVLDLQRKLPPFYKLYADLPGHLASILVLQALFRLKPIMLLKLPIMLLSSAPKSSL